jgi:drug/metabolite transporter, DME family
MTSDALPLAATPPAARDARRAVGIVMLLAASVLWSFAGIAVKVAELPPLAFTFWRSLAAAAALGVAMLVGIPGAAGRWPRDRWMAASMLLYTAVVALLITATAYGNAGRAILLQYTGPVFCALFAWVFQRRAITRRTWSAIAVAAVGITFMVIGANDDDATGGTAAAARRGGLAAWLPPLFGLASGVAFGALVLVLEKVNRAGASPMVVVLLNNLACAAVVLPLALLTTSGISATPRQFAIVGGTGIVQLALPYVLFMLALRHVHPVDATLLILLEPVLNPVWVALATAERPDVPTIIGGAAVLAALVIEATGAAGRGHAAPAAAKD